MSKTTGLLALLAGLLIALPGFAAGLKAPEKVKTGLRILSQVEADFGRKIAAKTYDRIPHENEEFIEGAGVLRLAITDEPAEFKASVNPALQKALDAAANIASISKTKDDAELASGEKTLAAALASLDALFPEPLRPAPR
jgi:hypothetical protein